MLSVAPHLVDVAKPDGFTAFHLATLQGHVSAAEVLTDTVSMKSTKSSMKDVRLP